MNVSSPSRAVGRDATTRTSSRSPQRGELPREAVATAAAGTASGPTMSTRASRAPPSREHSSSRARSAPARTPATEGAAAAASRSRSSGVGEEAPNRGRERPGVARRHEQAVLAVRHDLGDAADRVAITGVPTASDSTTVCGKFSQVEEQ